MQNFLANNHGYISMFATKGDDYPGTWPGQMEKIRPRHLLARDQLARGWGLALSFRQIWRLDHQNGCRSYSSLLCLQYVWIGREQNQLPRARRSLQSREWRLRPVTGESEVISPSDMMAISDSFSGGIDMRRNTLADLNRYGNTVTRQQDKANVVFCDGHVESVALEFLFEDTGDAALSRWNRDHQPHRPIYYHLEPAAPRTSRLRAAKAKCQG